MLEQFQHWLFNVGVPKELDEGIWLLCYLFALYFGDRPERRVGAVTLTVQALDKIIYQLGGFTPVEWNHSLVSFASQLVGVVLVTMVAVRARRPWLSLFCGAALLGFAAHVLLFLEPQLAGETYFVLGTMLRYLQRLIIVIGTVQVILAQRRHAEGTMADI